MSEAVGSLAVAEAAPARDGRSVALWLLACAALVAAMVFAAALFTAHALRARP